MSIKTILTGLVLAAAIGLGPQANATGVPASLVYRDAAIDTADRPA